MPEEVQTNRPCSNCHGRVPVVVRGDHYFCSECGFVELTEDSPRRKALEESDRAQDEVIEKWSKGRGRKDDNGKPMWDLVQPRALTRYVKVLTAGAQKYAPHNWMRVPNAKPRYIAAALRHLMEYLMGKRVDPESGEPVLAHVLCCVAFVLELDEIEAETPKEEHGGSTTP